GGYCAARDLDHSSSKVQEHIKKYLLWMKNDIGYDGWRYDLVKGYLGKYTKIYNQAAGAYMSVGEYYDASYDALLNWVNETGNTSMVFDFAFHDAMVKWGGGSDYSKIVWSEGSTDRPAGLCHSTAGRKYAVTFIDNHDTDVSHTGGNWPYNGDWLKANAIMIAAPGIPCVFWKHWANTTCRAKIKQMIEARKAMGVHSESDVVVNHKSGYYESTATGKNGKLKCFVGSGWSDPSGYTKACYGDGWAYYTTSEVPTGPVVTMSPTGGYVGQGGKVTLTTTKGTIYYTTDGSTPSASSTQYSAPISITTNKTTVKAIAIDGSAKSEIVSGTFLTERPAGITVQFKAPSSWTSCNAYAWSGSEEYFGGWPGTAVSKSGEYYTATVESESFNIIFNSGSAQTKNLTGITADACFDGSAGSLDAEGHIVPTSCGTPPVPPVPGEPVTVALAAFSDWSSIAVYAWDDNGALLGAWPGEVLSLSDGYYRKTISSYSGTLNIIFNNNNNKQQTTDITVTASTCYEINTADKGTDAYGNTTYGVKTSTSCLTDVEENTAEEFAIYPNPTTGELNISSSTEFVSARVTNLAGQTFEYDVTGNSLNVSNLAKGIYLIDLEAANGAVEKTKFIKK
ncbi:MAG: starch-binding protein, partial [Paludibacteraceae bacterium]|nr:starch-binding protein [Paludibacteraceae bacterium]